MVIKFEQNFIHKFTILAVAFGFC